MIVEHHYTYRDLLKKCHGCKWLELDSSEFYGVCVCPDNAVKIRNRSVLDRKCSFKVRVDIDK